MFGRKIALGAAGKQVTLFPSEEVGAPLVVLNNYSGDGSPVAGQLERIGCVPCSLLAVGGLDWNRDMTPWRCPPIGEGSAACEGGADEYLDTLLSEIMPRAVGLLDGAPTFACIAGYSLAGLFALYAAYRCEAFACLASMSGSLWFPGFAQFATTQPLVRAPERLYLSLGDHEARTRNPYLRTVRDNTEALAAFYQEVGIDVTYELNPGNHFKRPSWRTARGIAVALR